MTLLSTPVESGLLGCMHVSLRGPGPDIEKEYPAAAPAAQFYK